MPPFIATAAIHFNHQEAHLGRSGRATALRQWAAAAELLHGTGVELVVACEGMGSLQSPDEAETLAGGGPLLDAYRALALRERCTVVGCLKLREDAGIANAQAMLGPDGTVRGIYRKCFLTAGEVADGLVHGPGPVVVPTPAGRLGGAICYDLKFDALKTAYRALRPDIIAFSSMFHGGFQQQEWAFATRSYLVAACKDGFSAILDPLGRTLATASAWTLVARADLPRDHLVAAYDEEALARLRRRRDPGVGVAVAAELGAVLLTGSGAKPTCGELARDCGLVELADHLDAAAALRPVPLTPGC
jgi:predicted amidohydrolase